jgi:anti-sigma B factor antagonist
MLMRSEMMGDVLVVTPLIETLDADNHKQFRLAALGHLDGRRKVVLDLERLNFLDSSGLGAVLSCFRRVQVEAGEMVIASLSAPVRVIFELVRMHKVMGVYNNVEEALAALSTSGAAVRA